MAKRRRVWNSSVHEKYVREGRGSGWGPDYSPWIRVQDFSSRGVASRVKSRKTGRVHHLMSNQELAYFYILDWSDKVTDIREQFPLVDIEAAVKIAAQAGIRYPTDNISGYPYVLTCDFMITTVDGIKARTIKMTSELCNARVLEKLEIERRYWSAQGIDWKIVTEREISVQKSKNIQWLYTAYDNDESTSYQNEETQSQNLMMQLIVADGYSIREAAQTIEKEWLFPAGFGIRIFKRLVLSKCILINIEEPINLNAKGVALKA
jgi:hypothetical protein